jgi:hypothetical protein
MERSKKHLRDRRTALGAFAAGVLATVIGGLILNALTKPSSVADELEHQRSVASDQGWLVSQTLKSDIQGVGRPVYVLVLRDRPNKANPLGKRSDELRIFTSDTTNGETGNLEEAFSFRPPSGSTAGPNLRFTPRYNEDLDRNGTTEVVGAYYGNYVEGTRRPIPVIIDWSDLKGSFRVTPLVQDRPKVAPPQGGGSWINTAQTRYRTALDLSNVESGQHYKAYPVEEFTVRPSAALGGPILLAAFLVKAPSLADPRLIQLKGYQLDLSGGHPTVYECYPLHPVLAPIGERDEAAFQQDPDRFLATAWGKRTERGC